MKTKALIAACLLSLFAASNANADEADTNMLKVLSDRNKTACRELSSVFIRSKNGLVDPKVYGKAADCYVSEARLHAFGKRRELIIEGTTLSELPIKIISQQTGINLDFYRPLAGRTLRE